MRPPSPKRESKERKEDAPSPVAPSAAKAPELHPSSATQREIIWNALTLFAVLAILAGTALIFFGFIEFLGWFYPVLLPLGLAILVALLLDPPVTYLCRKTGLSRANSSVVVFIGVGILIGLFLTFLLPSLVDQSSKFFQDLPHEIEKGTKAVADHFEARPQEKDWVQANLSALPQKVLNLLYEGMAPVGQAFGFLLGFGFVPIYVFYFIADRDRIISSWRDYVPLRREWLRDEVVSVLDEIGSSLVAYFRGQIVVASCNGVLTTAGLVLIGLPDSLFLGLIAGALSVVPFLGIIVSIVPCLLLAFTSPDGGSWWFKPALVLVIFSVVQMIESLFISPRVQSHSTGLHPVAIILGILFWSAVLPGLLGPILAVPLTSSLVILLRRYIWQDSPPSANTAHI